MASRGNAQAASVDSHLSGAVEHRHLTARFPGIKGHKRSQGLWRALAAPHQVKAQRTIGRINERLGGNYTDTGFCPRHDGAHREVA